MAVSLERAHAQLLGQGQGLPVVGFGPLALWRLSLGRNLAQESQGVGFVAPFLMRTGELQCALRLSIRLVQTASEEIGLAQPDNKRRIDAPPRIAAYCPLACSSSGTASGRRPANAYAYPTLAASSRCQSRRSWLWHTARPCSKTAIACARSP